MASLNAPPKDEILDHTSAIAAPTITDDGEKPGNEQQNDTISGNDLSSLIVAKKAVKNIRVSSETKGTGTGTV